MSSFKDSIYGSNCTLFGGVNYSFVADRFGFPNSAIYLNNGYLKIPPGIYIHGDYSVVIWMKFKEFKFLNNLLEFANNDNQLVNNLLQLYLYHGGYIGSGVVESGNYQGSFIEISPPSAASSSFELNKWYQFVFVLKNTNAYLYVNSELAIKGIQTTRPSKIIRNNNFIGQSNYPAANINAIYDDIKIYDGALSEQLIKLDYFSFELTPSQQLMPTKMKKNANLIHHWDMSSLNDSICGSNCTLFGGINYSFAADRFGFPNSAIYLNNGYLQIPPGIYIHSDFTVIIWIKFYSFNNPYNYIWEFGNSLANNNIVSSFLYVGYSINLKIIENYNNTSFIDITPASLTSAFELNTWCQIVSVLKDKNIFMYVNGTLIATGLITTVPSETVRSSNFLGQTNIQQNNNIINNNYYVNAVYDDLKIFKGALTEDEIKKDFFY
jgi:hypothetical protein